jgi:hypothetical protein
MSDYAVGSDGTIYTTAGQKRIWKQLAIIVKYYSLKH